MGLIAAPILIFFRLLLSLNYTAEMVETDRFNSFYLVNGNKLERMNRNGQLTGSHTAKTFGRIHSVDPTNPLKTLVYYRDFNTILFLDNMLAPVGEPINLPALGFDRITQACQSYNNGLWLFDSGNNELLRLDANLNVSHRSGRIVQATGFVPEPVSMTEYGNNLYLNDPERGIHMFDVYGTYLKTLPFLNLKDFQVAEDRIIYMKNDSIISFDLKLLSDSAVALPDTQAIATRIFKDRLLLIGKEKVLLYDLK